MDVTGRAQRGSAAAGKTDYAGEKVQAGRYTAVIQAGGKGTRLRALTGDAIPKPMLPLNGKPMLEWQIGCLRRYGVEEIVLIIGHLGEKVREYFGDGSRFSVRIHYITEDQERPLGSAGALYWLRERYPAEQYILVFGDIMFDMDLPRWIRFHEERASLLTPVAHPNGHPQDSDLLVLDDTGRVTGLLGKKAVRAGWYDNCVNAGLFLLGREALAGIPEPYTAGRTDFEQDVLRALIPGGRVYAYRTTEYVKDVGTVERFTAAAEEQRRGKWAKRNLSRPQRCIFLDRDGTINAFRGLISREEELELYPWAAEALRLINASDYLAIIATNQPAPAKGLCTVEDIRRIHRKLATMLGEQGAYFDDIVFCPHHPEKGFPDENPVYKMDCGCRKPKIGMILQMAEKYNISLPDSYIIGDTTRDMQTGENAGMHTVLVHTGEGGTERKFPAVPEREEADLLEAVRGIVGA